MVISPKTMTIPVLVAVSQATLEAGSSTKQASRTASEIWSAILSGWPRPTDSEVKRNLPVLDEKACQCQSMASFQSTVHVDGDIVVMTYGAIADDFFDLKWM